MTVHSYLSRLYWRFQGVLRRVAGSALDERYFRRRTSSDVELGLANLRHPHRAWLVARLIDAEANGAGLTPHFFEVGCGWGPNLWTLAERIPGARLTGVDISPASIALGRESARRFGISNVTLFEGEASHLAKFQSRSVDVVFTDATLLYLGPDRIERCLRELVRISCGRVVLLEMHDEEAGCGGYYTRDGWVRNYRLLAMAAAPNAAITLEKLPEVQRPVGRWPKYGALIQIDVRGHDGEA